MIGYDLDGVLIPDVEPGLDWTVVNAVRALMAPIFLPRGEWCVITSRSIDDVQYVRTWVDKFFVNRPKWVEHSCDDGMAVEYKARVIKAHPEITVYVESNKTQAVMIQELVGERCTVICFQELLELATWALES